SRLRTHDKCLERDAARETTPTRFPSGTAAMESISERLSQLENLYFPRSLQPSATSPSLRKSLLLDLIRRDLPVFLERYGPQLTYGELKEFDKFTSDYEVNWHLNHLRSVISPTSEEVRARSTMIKNRRRAYMDKLVCGGEYFSEDSMREREPYLHHEYVGQFQDLSGRRMARPGERWSDTLMRRVDERILVEKIRGEQERLGVAERDWVGNEREQQEEQEEEEEEDDDDDDDDDDNDELQEAKEEMGDEENGEPNGTLKRSQIRSSWVNRCKVELDWLAEVLLNNQDASENPQPSTARPNEGANLSAEELEDRMEQFIHIMQQKFLSGEDHQHLDYSKIDEDETLDDHWMREANHDAEEKYFADV
ncbi:hypothetical protein RJ640_012962, partial [Escallonia rubra]